MEQEILIHQVWRDTYFDRDEEPSKRLIRVLELLPNDHCRVQTIVDRFGNPETEGRKRIVKYQTLRTGYRLQSEEF